MTGTLCKKPVKQIALQNIAFVIWTFCTTKGLKFLKNVHNQDVDVLFCGRFVPHEHRPK
jgi:hypothetical protein